MKILKGTTTIALDLSCRHAPTTIYAKQGDIDSRFVKVRFFYGGRKFDLSQAARSEIRVKKPDGTITVNEGEFGDDGVTYPLTEQSLSVNGEAQADFLLYGENNEVISCVPSRLMIAEAPVGDEAVVSTNEYTAFREEFSQLQSDLSNISSSFSSFKNQHAAQMASMAAAIGAVKSLLGGLTFVRCTQEEYDALESPDENTVYYAVDDNGKVKHYLGGAELSGGSDAPQQASVSATNLTTVMGIAQTEEVN